MRSFNQFINLLFHILLWFHGFADAATKGAPNLKAYKAPVGDKVGVELDYALAKAGAENMIAGKPVSKGKMQNRLIFMAHYTVPGRLTDPQLVQIAMDGYMDMLNSASQYDIHKTDLPSVMTVFYYSNEIIISSSQKGGQAITYTRDNAVSALVDQCIAPAVKSNDAKCGEMSAAQLFQRLHPTIPISTANIVTVTVISENRNNAFSSKEADLKVWPPCSKDVGGGCDQIIGPGKVIAREVKPEVWDAAPKPVTYSKAGWIKTPMDVLSFVAPIQ
ncbi:hypothetical protein BU23DRAFT_503543 [Bimuria novae-zelandiae CBS 107.79]|uniref:Uncharacterized protein n=1 Tax=Bimuria novae-zelandiae CBS 107.79 TaxID=1447943 RepID=A0A6A5VIB9_9PLEO|nr:hypothetical protein BU23DRAFT_503543 [Bimuria novae-zelandiae CBS 107.79]